MTRYPVLLPAGFAPPPQIDEAAAWYRAVSGGAAVLRAEVVARPGPDPDWGAYAARGGKGRPPGNSQELAELLLGELDAAGWEAVAAAGSRVLVVVPDEPGFAPHTWRLRRGGFHLGGRRWCRRYAVVPAGASLGAYAHELGHLLFGWPDLDRAGPIGAGCLMGAGGHHPPGDAPAPPCPPLRVAAGWEVPVAAGRATRVADLAGGRLFSAVLRDGAGVIVEGRDGSRGIGAVRIYDPEPRLVASVSVGADDQDRPVLAVVAAAVAARPTVPAR